MNLYYDPTCSHDKFVDLLRKFNLINLLVKIQRESVSLIQDGAANLPCGMKCINYKLQQRRAKSTQVMTAYMTGWNLIDLAYEAICATNDFRGEENIQDQHLYFLLTAMENVRQKEEKQFLDTVSENEKNIFNFYLWGFCGEQFKIEAPGKVFANAARELYIIFESSKKVKNMPDISNVVVQETGVGWEQVITSIFLIWFGSSITPYIAEIKKNIKFDASLSENDFDKVVKRYSSRYDEVRNSNLGRQLLYIKPYIQTSRDIISINNFLDFFLYEHCILWILRDHFNYQENGNRIFTSKFGECFEVYFEELLQTYFSSSSYRKIPEGKISRADWEIITNDYCFLVEQKSALIGLLAKQQETDIEATKNFAKNNIIKAIKQLYKTQTDFSNGKYIKIILLYEDYLQPDILDAVFTMAECSVADDGYYWIATINELEMLFDLYQKDYNLFKDIVRTKLERDHSNSNEGRSLLMIMNERGINTDSYLMRDQFKYYRNFAKTSAAQHLYN